MSTISGTIITQTVTLGSINTFPTYASPLTITSTGTITAAAYAVYGTGAGATVVNEGAIAATPAEVFGFAIGTGIGIDLKAGGSVTNGDTDATSARISGAVAPVPVGSYGVEIGGATGTVVNFGTIAAADGDGVKLAAGGSADNIGLIAGYGAGVYIGNGPGTLNNSGTIEGAGFAGHGVYMAVPTAATGLISNAQGGLISGRVLGIWVDALGGAVSISNAGSISGGVAGVILYGGAGTVTNSGMIDGTDSSGVGIYVRDTGGSIGNAQGALISGSDYGVHIGGTAVGMVTNFGTIVSTGTGNTVLPYPAGVYISGVGTLVNGASNAASAFISGFVNGIFIGGTATGTVTNFGTIEGTGTLSDGVHLFAGTVNNASGGFLLGVTNGAEIDSSAAAVSNSGSIGGTGTGGAGIYLTKGGSVLNNTNGLITGVLNGVAIGHGGGTVVNDGTIEGTGTSSAGVYLTAGGTVINNGTISGSIFGILINSAAGTVLNDGNIVATATSGVGIDVTLGTVTNRGTVIAGTSGVGIDLFNGNVTNSGTILAPTAVIVRYGTFFNGGVVEGAVYGIELSPGTSSSGGKVTASGTVIGATGISVAPTNTASQTASVGGTVIGTSGTAVALAGGDDRLIVDPGASFTGMLYGGGGSSVLEIAASGSGTGGTGGAVGAAGTIAYVTLGSVVNFNALQVDASATVAASGVLSVPTLINQGQVNIGSGDQFAFASVSAATTGVIDLRTGGTVTFSGVVANQTLEFNPPGGTAVIDQPGEFGGTVTNFTGALDVIDLTGLAFAGTTGVPLNVSNVLTVTEGTSSAAIQLGSASYTGITWVAQSDGGSGTDITAVACFCRGTRVRSGAGEVAVEDLAIGDRVVTLAGAARPVKWIGRRSYDPRFVAGNPAVLPIRITAGALAEGVPARDLWLSPEHALLVDGMLVPAGLLANGATIHQVERVERVEYFHIELDGHDVIFAEGAAAETYVDCDNRLMFQNGAEYAALYPDARPAPWQFCAPRVEPGSPGLTAIRAALLARAEGFGHRLDLDPDPDLHLIVDGRTIWPHSIAGERHRFRLPSGSRAVWLASRSAVPAEVETAGSRDRRRLGVPLARIALFDAECLIEAGHGDAALSDGFHADEGLQRWTDGRARLPDAWLRAFPGGAVLDVHLVPTGLAYRLPPPARIAA